MGFAHKNKYVILLLSLSVILTFILFGINQSLVEQTNSDSIPTSQFKNWNNRTLVTYTKELESQWKWTYSNDNSEFKQVCNTWAHDSLFYAEGELVSYYDNKVLTGRERSYLRNYNGDILYEVETGSPWETIINMNRILVSYVINDPEDNIVGYVSGQSFLEDDFTINDINGLSQFRLYRNKVTLSEWRWEFTQHSGNIFPLSLAVGIASKISFNGNDNTDLCNRLFHVSYMFIWISLGLSIIFVGVFIYSIYYYYYKNSIKEVKIHDSTI